MFGIGVGDNVLRLTDEQFELIAAFLYNTRLDSPAASKHAEAACQMLELISGELGDAGFVAAAEQVKLSVTIDDAAGNEIFSSGPDHFICLEV
jgi:hypothetical protein